MPPGPSSSSPPLHGLPFPASLPPLSTQPRPLQIPPTSLGSEVSEGPESDTETVSDRDSLFDCGEGEGYNTDSTPPPSPSGFLSAWDLGHLFQGDVDAEDDAHSEEESQSPLRLFSALGDSLHSDSESITEALGNAYEESPGRLIGLDAEHHPVIHVMDPNSFDWAGFSQGSTISGTS